MFLINDLVVKEHICNMHCTYCLTGTSNLKKAGMEKVQECAFLRYQDGSVLQKQLDSVTDTLHHIFQIPILKISGGEILLISGLTNYLKKHAPNYKVVQILTNGLLLDDQILMEFRKIGNICLQISLDHHTLKGNQYRTAKQKDLDQILLNLDKAVRYEIPVEINCVLHNKNTHILNDYVKYLSKYDNKITFFPFPVRGAEKDSFFPEKEQLRGLSDVLKSYRSYKGILPPKPYLERLLCFLQTGVRDIPCIFPRIAIGSFDDGNITPCANYWFTCLCNILHEREPEKIAETVEQAGIYHVLLSKHTLFNECRTCFTPWDILNLYAKGEISLDEVCSIPVYAHPEVRQVLKKCLAKG